MENNDKENKAQGQLKQEPKDLVLTITLKTDGGIGVQGPGDGQFYDEPTCDYLMKKAGRFIEAHNARAAKSAIFTPFQKKNKNTGGAFGGGRF